MRSLAIACVAFLVAGSAQAQARATARGEVYGLGGITFGTETSSVVGGGLRIAVAPTVQVFGEAGRLQNVLPKSLKEDVDTLVSAVAAYYGMPFTMDVDAPAFYGLGGVRVVVPTAGRVRPFVEAGLGLANLSVDLEAKVAGFDISSEVEEEAGLESETELLLALGGGIRASLSRSIGLDAGYRFVRINTDDPTVNTSMIYAGLHVAF